MLLLLLLLCISTVQSSLILNYFVHPGVDGQSVIIDKIGGRNGTVVGEPLGYTTIAGRTGVLYLGNSSVTLPEDAFGQNFPEKTITFWIRISSFPEEKRFEERAFIVFSGNRLMEFPDFVLNYNRTFECAFQDTFGIRFQQQFGELAENQWYFVVLQFAPQYIIFRVNDEVLSFKAVSPNFTPLPTEHKIGFPFFNGILSDFRIYDSILTDDEVKQVKNLENLNIPLGEFSQRDLIGFHRNGTMTGNFLTNVTRSTNYCESPIIGQYSPVFDGNSTYATFQSSTPNIDPVRGSVFFKWFNLTELAGKKEIIIGYQQITTQNLGYSIGLNEQKHASLWMPWRTITSPDVTEPNEWYYFTWSVQGNFEGFSFGVFKLRASEFPVTAGAVGGSQVWMVDDLDLHIGRGSIDEPSIDPAYFGGSIVGLSFFGPFFPTVFNFSSVVIDFNEGFVREVIDHDQGKCNRDRKNLTTTNFPSLEENIVIKDKSCYFNGNSSLEFPSLPHLEFTVSLWVLVENEGSGTNRIILSAKDHSNSLLSSNGYSLSITEENKWSAFIGSGNHSQIAILEGPTVVPYEWHFITFGYRDFNPFLWIDCELVATSIQVFFNPTQNEYILGMSHTQEEAFIGYVDEIFFYDKLVRPTEMGRFCLNRTQIPRPTMGPNTSPPPSTTASKRTSSSNSLEIGIGIAIGIGALVCLSLFGGALVFVLFRKKKNSKKIVVEEKKTDYVTIPFMELSNSNEIAITKASSSWVITAGEITKSKEIGRGAFGVVYSGVWRGQQVAIKQLLKTDEESEKELLTELSLMQNLRPHANVIQMLGYIENPLSIITNFYKNGSLKKLLLSKENITEEQQLRWTLEIANGLAHLHKENIIHRDLATRNVLLTETLVAVVSDFGMSRISKEEVESTTSTIGPLKWMSPESIRERKYSIKSDVWAYAVTVWEIWVRAHPFPDLSPVQAALNVAQLGQTLAFINSTPPYIKEICKKCWSIEPNERPTMPEIISILQTEQQ